MNKEGFVWYEDSAEIVGDLAEKLTTAHFRLRDAWSDAALAEVEWPCNPEVLAVLASVGHLLAVFDSIVEEGAKQRENL